MILIHNRAFDRPRVVAAHGIPMPIEATSDEMDVFHLLYNAYKRKLGFVSSLNPLNHGLKMWKHLAHTDAAYYSCVDALALLRNHYFNREQLRATGAETAHTLLHRRLDPVLDHMHEVGMAVDDNVRSTLSSELALELEALTQQMNAVVPEVVRSPQVWVSAKNALAGRERLAARLRAANDPAAERMANAPIFTVPAERKALRCTKCGAVDVKAEHVTRKFLKVVPDVN